MSDAVVTCRSIRVCASSVSQSLLGLLLALGGAVCDVVEAGSDTGQVEQRPRRLLHLLVVALRRLLHRAPLLQRQRVANAPRSAFGPGQAAARQGPGARPRAASLSAQGLLRDVCRGGGGGGDVRVQRDLPGLGLDVRLDFHGDDVVVVQRGGRGGALGGGQPAGGLGSAVSVVLLEVLAAGWRGAAGRAVRSSAQKLSQG